MSGIIVVFPKIEDANSIRNLLVRNGFSVIAACTTGAQALNYTDGLAEGIVICGYRLADMMYSELKEYLPSRMEMLLLTSSNNIMDADMSGILTVRMPLKVHELLETINMMLYAQARQKKKRKAKGQERSPKDKQTIETVKKMLMERNDMTEEEAHRYIQKASMDSGNDMVETAKMLLTLMGNS
ncbi:MAG: ANTAR domain-containing response regulator [Lachnospiraceae bacterium]